MSSVHATEVEYVIDLAGIFVFAVTGALVAVRKRFDVVGMAVLAEITALGGGVLRDLVIGAVPPAAFRDVGYTAVPIVATALTAVWHPHLERIRRTVLVLDAAGLGLFSVAGAMKALTFGLGAPAAAALGVTTAIGGGILRDVLAREVPSVLHDRQLYIIPALLGAGTATAASLLGARGYAVTLVTAALAFGVRLLALRLRWRMPRARGFEDHA
ncbi:TRIC cation channel family protein [Actinoallomurus spadix]|uniref:Trimeric intracellular cation channel family protein n=1 Tax=Actinoallomurus spadix TaxID=79912 RepID=A0ABN0XQS9_9ACTN|nr:TRIC cation channel family protein [Actinoallomurus spadix]MCO5988339.1 TRIC cation channel family protein [Actinoallomurus spadix]